MLQSYIRRIRRQPKEVRNRHAFFIATAFTAVVAGIWGYTQMRLDPETVRQAGNDAAPPFSNVIDVIKDQWASVSEAIPSETSSTSAAATIDGSEPSELQLDPGNIEAIRESMVGTEELRTVPRVEKASSSNREVQIVIVSGTSSTTSVPKAREE